MQDPTRHLPVLRRTFSRLKQTLRDQRGVSAVAFAISFAVLAPMALGIFDVYTQTEQRGKLQDALDAAALYAARSPVYTTADVDAVGNKALTANLQMVHGATLQSSDFTLVGNKVVAQAQIKLAAYAPMEFSHSPVTVNSEVTRSGNDLEVALVLDNTGSMSGAPMTSLQSAANQLIDLVVSDTQTPFYSKIAIVPYSNSVNPGAYLTTVRGAPVAGTDSTPLPGKSKIKFTSMTGTKPTFSVGNCVSERTGLHAFDDVSPSAASASLVGWVYPPTSGSNNCISAAIQPLTSDKPTLHSEISTLTAANSTAGHIGLAWGWYMISPNWASLFPSASKPAAYGTDHLLKVVILMTDGAFNTAYCKGVISGPSSDPSGGAGSNADHINCASPNGNAFTQAQTLCDAMKAAPNHVIIYTVGFLHGGDDPQAKAILNNCATDPQHVYFPTDGGSLQVAFQSIAADLNRLRISH
jgi:Flp pilus assembly protein TadG